MVEGIEECKLVCMQSLMVCRVYTLVLPFWEACNSGGYNLHFSLPINLSLESLTDTLQDFVLP